MCNASWDWTFPEVERSNQIWQPFQKRQFARTNNVYLVLHQPQVPRYRNPSQFVRPQDPNAICL